MASSVTTKELARSKRRVEPSKRNRQDRSSVEGNIGVLNELFGLWKKNPVTTKEIRGVRRRIWGAT